ncbi:MAG: hypothetical protein WBR18_00990 [Anaerolineales bacterium]
MRNGWFTLTLVLLAGLLAACAGENAPVQPTPSGSLELTRGPVYLDEVDLRVMESMPVQLELHLVGHLPTPCHKLEWQSRIAADGGKIEVEVYSQAPVDLECIQVLSPIDETINLGEVPPGHYSVMVNGEQVGEFDS